MTYLSVSTVYFDTTGCNSNSRTNHQVWDFCDKWNVATGRANTGWDVGLVELHRARALLGLSTSKSNNGHLQPALRLFLYSCTVPWPFGKGLFWGATEEYSHCRWIFTVESAVMLENLRNVKDPTTATEFCAPFLQGFCLTAFETLQTWCWV